MILFMGCFYYLSVHFHLCCFYIQYLRGIKEIFCFKLCSILSTWWRNIRLFHTAFVFTPQKRSRFEPAPPSRFEPSPRPSPIFVATPLEDHNWWLNTKMLGGFRAYCYCITSHKKQVSGIAFRSLPYPTRFINK